jgi:hypothetical protein
VHSGSAIKSGWGFIGVVTRFEPMYESRVINTSGIEGEIGEKMSDLHKEDIMDRW